MSPAAVLGILMLTVHVTTVASDEPTQEALIEKAKLAEKMGRYDDMADTIIAFERLRGLQDSMVPYTAEHRELTAIAFDESIGEKHASLKVLSDLEAGTNDSLTIRSINDYRAEIVQRLLLLCRVFIGIAFGDLHDYSIMSPRRDTPAVIQLFYRTMMGDAYRYKAEVEQGSDRDKSVWHADDAYTSALSDSDEWSDTDVLIRVLKLRLALKHSDFLYEVKGDHEAGLRLAETAHNRAEGDKHDPNNSPEFHKLFTQLEDKIKLWKELLGETEDDTY